MEVIGIEKVDYVSKKGNPVKGVKLHMCYQSDKVQGMAAMSEFISERILCDVKVGDEIKLFYNKFGQVSEVFIA